MLVKKDDLFMRSVGNDSEPVYVPKMARTIIFRHYHDYMGHAGISNTL